MSNGESIITIKFIGTGVDERGEKILVKEERDEKLSKFSLGVAVQINCAMANSDFYLRYQDGVLWHIDEQIEKDGEGKFNIPVEIAPTQDSINF